MVGTHHAVFGVDGTAFDQRQQVTLYPFARDIRATRFTPFADLVDLVDEDDTLVFDGGDHLILELLRVDQARCLLLDQLLESILDLQLALLGLTLAHILEQALQLIGHLFHARRCHDLDTHLRRRQLQLDLLVIEFALTQLLAEDLAGVAVWLLILAPALAGGGQQGIEDALFGGLFGAETVLLDLLFAHHLHRHIGQIADDGVHLLADVTHLGEFCGFDLDEGGVGQLGQTAGNLGLSHPGRANHQDVFR